MTDDDLPMDTGGDLFHFTDGAMAYAGYYTHRNNSPLHTHSFMEIAFVTSGEGTHVSVAGRQRLTMGDVILLRPGVWHGYEDCTSLELCNCCFSVELLRRELRWTREDALIGYLLWSGPYSAQGRGMLTTRLDRATLESCRVHLAALNALSHEPVARHRGDIVGRLALLFGALARVVAQTQRPSQDAAGPAHPVVGQAMRMLETQLAYPWTLGELSERLHLSGGYLVRLFKTATGLPPMAYLARLRAEHAAVLLLQSDQPITCIGRDVGWSDQNYFARRFRAHYGLSATAYRAQFATDAVRLAGGAGVACGKSPAGTADGEM